jgi:hypothetical protein
MCSCSFTWSDITSRRKAKEAYIYIYIYIYEFGETLWREMRNQIVNKGIDEIDNPALYQTTYYIHTYIHKQLKIKKREQNKAPEP